MKTRSAALLRHAACALALGPATLVPASPAHADEDTAQIIPLPLNPVVPDAQRGCTVKTASGLGYSVLRSAPGAKPEEGDYVLVNYIGYLAANGQAFDQNMGSVFRTSEVIPGFAEGLRLAAKGSIVRLCIPSQLGYGPRGTGPIPANADLVFQVEMLDFRTAAEVEAARAAHDAAAQQPAAPESPAPQP